MYILFVEFSGFQVRGDLEEMLQEEMATSPPQILCYSLQFWSKEGNVNLDLVERMTDHVLLVGHR